MVPQKKQKRVVGEQEEGGTPTIRNVSWLRSEETGGEVEVEVDGWDW